MFDILTLSFDDDDEEEEAQRGMQHVIMPIEVIFFASVSNISNIIALSHSHEF